MQKEGSYSSVLLVSFSYTGVLLTGRGTNNDNNKSIKHWKYYKTNFTVLELIQIHNYQVNIKHAAGSFYNSVM